MDNSHAQQELPLPAAYQAERAYRELLELIRDVADKIGRKEICYELSDWPEARLSHSGIDNALVDRDRHQLKARHLVYLMLREEGTRILESLAHLCGCEIEPQRPLTPEEELRRLKRRGRQRLGDLWDEIEEEALRR